MTNKMAEVAKLLGVKLEEEFDIVLEDGKLSDYSPYRITDYGLYDKYTHSDNEYLINLLTGDFTIKKRPFIPQKDEYYYYINNSDKVDCGINYNDTYDYRYIVTGNCFRTKEEAEANKDAILAKVADFFNKA